MTMKDAITILKASGVPFTSPTMALRYVKESLGEDTELVQFNDMMARLVGHEVKLENRLQAKYAYLYMVTNIVKYHNEGEPTPEIESVYNESVDTAAAFIRKNTWVHLLEANEAQDPLVEGLHTESATRRPVNRATSATPGRSTGGRKSKIDPVLVRAAYDKHVAAGLNGNTLNEALAAEFGFTASAGNNHVYKIRLSLKAPK